MLDLSWTELALIAVVAIIVIGPKDLPRAMKTVAQGVRKMRGLASEFQSGIDQMMREAELDDVKKTVEKASRFDVGAEIERSIDPGGRVAHSMDVSKDLQSLDAAEAGKDFAPPAPATAEPPAATAPRTAAAPTPSTAPSSTTPAGTTAPEPRDTAVTLQPMPDAAEPEPVIVKPVAERTGT